MIDFRRMFKSLHIKLLAAFLLLTLLPVVEIVIYGQVYTHTALTTHAVDSAAYQVNLLAESMASSLDQVRGDVQYLAELRSLRMLRELRAQTPQADLVTQWQNEVALDFLVLASTRPMYQGLRFFDLEGNEIIYVKSDGQKVDLVEPLTNRQDTPSFQQVAALAPGEIYVSSFGYDQDFDAADAPFVHYALKLADGDGIVMLDIHVGWLLRRLPANSGSDLWAIVDAQGRYLVHPQDFNPTTNAVSLQAMFATAYGSFEDGNNVYVFSTIYPTGNTQGLAWVVYRATPKSVLYADVTRFFGVAVVFVGSALLAAVVLAFFVSRWLVKPISTLKEMAQTFGDTGISPILPAALPDDEIGALTRAFGNMAQELERKRTQEHRLIERLIGAQEEERKLVAYDLHDGLIQQMVGARFYLTNCRDHCPIGADTAKNGIQRGCDALTDAITEGRRIIEGLRPAVLDDLGLAAAIEEVAQSTAQAAGWQLELNIQPLTKEPDKTVATTLFRITQEALNNARKHAQAKHVRLSLHNGHGIDLIIEDDGKGFDTTAINGDGHGLGITTMQERAALIQGRCEINSEPGGGTHIHVWVPQSIVSSSFIPFIQIS